MQHCIRGFAGAGTFVLQAVNWHKLFPKSRVMNRYYNTDFDYSRAQQVQSIGTSAYVVRRSTWEQVGMFDERFGQFMVDLAYNFTLNQRGYKRLLHAVRRSHPLRRPEHQSDGERSLRDQRDALIAFNDSYAYFGSWRITSSGPGGRAARLYLRMLEYHLRSDKSVVKGPGAPSRELRQRSIRRMRVRQSRKPGISSLSRSRASCQVAIEANLDCR